jgi:hypothetical protein
MSKANSVAVVTLPAEVGMRQDVFVVELKRWPLTAGR